MRVGLFYVAIFLFLCGALHAEQGFTLAVNCGASVVKMTGYNDTINSANAYNTSLGINSKLKKLDTGISPEIIVGYDFAAPVESLEVYLKNSLILLNDSGSTAVWPDMVIAQSMKSDLSAIYTGLGARFNFASENIPALTGYAGADAGLCHYYWNFISEETYKANGDNLYKVRKEWQTAVPGISAEAGINWWLTGNMGISIKGGYRLAAGKVMVKIINISGWTGATEGEDYMDYSGFYWNAGLNFRFEQPAASGQKVKGGQFPDIALWLYNEAQDLYGEGLYRQAAQKIKEAQDTAPGNPQLEDLADKIQSVLKTEVNADNVKKLLKEADEFKDKNDIKKARMRYSEAGSMDPENKQAKYNLDGFAVKAAENYAMAVGLKNRGSLREALAAAKLAYDYGGNEDAWNLKNSLQAQLKNKKEQDRLYNEGVEQYQKGDYKNAAESWAGVISIDPDDREAAANLEKAKQKMAAETGDEKTGVSSALGEAKNAFNIGNIDEAGKKCEYVLRMDPGNTEAAQLEVKIKKLEEENKKEDLNKR